MNSLMFSLYYRTALGKDARIFTYFKYTHSLLLKLVFYTQAKTAKPMTQLSASLMIHYLHHVWEDALTTTTPNHVLMRSDQCDLTATSHSRNNFNGVASGTIKFEKIHLATSSSHISTFHVSCARVRPNRLSTRYTEFSKLNWNIEIGILTRSSPRRKRSWKS